MRLIDADELKRAFEKVYPLATNEMGCVANKRIYDIIDNTPTVDLWEMRQEATENALKKAEVLYARPKGEWIKSGKTTFFCSKCGREINTKPFTRPDNYPFCHCGAEMKGGME